MLLLNKLLFAQCYSETPTDFIERSLLLTLRVLLRGIY